MGSERSQKIIKASKYLIEKYLPGFEIIYYCYNGILPEWAPSLAEFLSQYPDEKIIFGLDDYLIEAPINMEVYTSALSEMTDPEVVCIKLCKNTPEEFAAYPVTTQYTIWRREYLISLLKQTTDPWKFEMEGSKLLDKKALLRTCLQYDGNSALSFKWPGVNFGNLKEEDVYYLKANRML